MAYNSYFPAGYQPMYYQPAYQPPQVAQPVQQTTAPQTQPQNNGNGLTWVQGEAGAKSFLLAPNTTVMLMDSENDTFYLKSADASGMPTLRIFDYTGTLLGRKFADFIAFSAPEAIVLFGGLARSKEFLYEPMMKAMNDNVLKIWKDKVKIVFSQLKESDAAILGASALAWEL